MGPRPNSCPIRTKCSASPKMKVVLLLLPLIAAVITAPEARFTCEECVREMHGLAAMVKMGAIPIHDYLRDNYCPALLRRLPLQILRWHAVCGCRALLRRWRTSRLPDSGNLPSQRVHL